ncbi:MAG: DUF748 domain-containing protein [Geobacter sp.]|nr:DUF748 domain-containing protein [Geobacter sp.]
MNGDNETPTSKPGQPHRPEARALQKMLRWIVGIVASITFMVFIASFLLDEPLRRTIEEEMNKSLKGYSVRVPKLHLQLVGFTTTIRGLTVIQNANPKPPVAYFPLLRFSIQWREILEGRLVAELDVERPELSINLPQLRSEVTEKVKLKERGWQQALEAIYPLKINKLSVSDGSITYIDQDPKRPLQLTRLNLKATNIRNVRVQEKVYPSTFHLDTAIFGTGRGEIDGRANILGEPYPGVNAKLELKDIPLDYFKPVISRANLSIRKGIFSASGEVEYAPTVKNVHLKELMARDMEIDYIHDPRTAVAEKRRAAKVRKAAKKADEAGMRLRIDELKLKKSTFGMVNMNARHPYRVFLADTDLTVANISSKYSQGPVRLDMRGKFMGSGATSLDARFRPDKAGPDFDLRVRIDNTRMTDMNDLLRTYGDFDVAGGRFSLYSDMRVRKGRISGYVKPFFREMDVYDRRQDRKKKFFHQMYEMMVGGAAGILESWQWDSVATRADVSGSLATPRVSTWQVVVRLVQNAFFKAILPGFEREVARKQRK